MRGLTYGPPSINWLITADLHLTDRPRDAYRFGLFKWLAEQQKTSDVTATFILGDLTDRKDNHSAALVNRIVEELLRLKPPVYILQGNHDAFERSSPFFKFLNCVEGISFITEPTLIPELELALIPHHPTQEGFDEACKIIPPKWGVFIHQCINGAVSETGLALTGLTTKIIESRDPRLWFCGDIHKPQMLTSGAIYVGAPYHVRFGDHYVPRVFLLHDRVGTFPSGINLHFPTLSRWSLTIEEPFDMQVFSDIQKGDQVKIKVWLPQERITDWPALRARTMELCVERGFEVFGIDLEVTKPQVWRVPGAITRIRPRDIFADFCKGESIPNNLREVGLEFIDVQH